MAYEKVQSLVRIPVVPCSTKGLRVWRCNFNLSGLFRSLHNDCTCFYSNLTLSELSCWHAAAPEEIGPFPPLCPISQYQGVPDASRGTANQIVRGRSRILSANSPKTIHAFDDVLPTVDHAQTVESGMTVMNAALNLRRMTTTAAGPLATCLVTDASRFGDPVRYGNRTSAEKSRLADTKRDPLAIRPRLRGRKQSARGVAPRGYSRMSVKTGYPGNGATTDNRVLQGTNARPCQRCWKLA